MADDSKLYTLTVPNYSSNLLTELNNLRTNNLCCDVRICTADEGFLYAHKIVICCVSPYFRERINLTSHEPDTIDLVDTSHHLLTCVINFVYTGTLQVSIIHLQSMVQLLNKLEIKDALAMLEDLRTSCNGNDSITDSDLNETPCSEVAEVNNKEVGCEEEDSSFTRVRNLSDNETDIEEYEDIIEQLNHNVDSHKESEDMAEETSIPIVKENIATKKPRKSVNKKCKTAAKRPRKRVAPVKISLKKKVVVTTTADVDGKGDTEFKPLGDDSLNESKVDAQTEAVGDYIVKLEPPDSMDDSFDHNKDSPIKKKVKSDSQSKSKQCKICDEVFPTYKEYLVHRKTHAQSPGGVKKKRIQKKPYLCSICSRAWSSAIRRACHEYSKHGIPFDSSFKLYSCTFEGCNYISANKRYVDNHMRGTHSDERPHVCEYCGKAFKMPGALWTHTNIHTKLKEYKCEDCGMNFHQQSGLDIKSTKSEVAVSSNSSEETSIKIDETSTQPEYSSEKTSHKILKLPSETSKDPVISSGKKTPPNIDNLLSETSAKCDNSRVKTFKIGHLHSKTSVKPYQSRANSSQVENSKSKISTMLSTKLDEVDMKSSSKLDELTLKKSTRIDRLIKNTLTQLDNSTEKTSTQLDNSNQHTLTDSDSIKEASTELDRNIDNSKHKPPASHFECDKCLYKSDRRTNLLRHLKSHEKEGSRLNHPKSSRQGQKKSQEYLCEKCAKTYKTKFGLTLHKKQHDGEFKYVCSICSMGYNQQTQFRFHFSTHQATAVQCCYCKKAFVGHSSLKRHKTVCSLNPNVPKDIDRGQICEECGQSFSSKDALLYHVKGKHGTASYICNICGKAYAWRSSLRTHKLLCMKKSFLISIPDTEN